MQAGLWSIDRNLMLKLESEKPKAKERKEWQQQQAPAVQ